MIIRIGDERRPLLDEHLKKLRDLFVSDDTLKHSRSVAIESLIQAATNLPHKAFVYGALLALIAQTAEMSLVLEIVQRAIGSL